MIRGIVFFCALWGLQAILGAYPTADAYEGHSGLNMDKLLDAIYLAEGGNKASVPYGLIYDRWCVEAGACRYYAGEIIRVHLSRCKPSEDPISCVARQYAPKSHSPLNEHWERNVRYHYERLTS